MPAVLPPAIMFVNLARSSGVGNFVRSMITISLKGSYLMLAPFSIYFCLRVGLLSFTCVGLNQVFVDL